MKITVSTELSSKFILFRKQTKKLIQSKYYHFLKSLCEKLKSNPKQFWCFCSLKSKSERIPQAVSRDNTVATDSLKKAELFNSFFGTVFSIPSKTATPSVIDVVNPYLLKSLETTDGAVETTSKNLDWNKAIGVHGIPARILKICAKELASVNPLKFFSISRTSKAVCLGYGRGPILHQYIRMVRRNWSVTIVQFHCFLLRLNARRGLCSLPYTTILCPISLSGNMRL